MINKIIIGLLICMSFVFVSLSILDFKKCVDAEERVVVEYESVSYNFVLPEPDQSPEGSSGAPIPNLIYPLSSKNFTLVTQPGWAGDIYPYGGEPNPTPPPPPWGGGVMAINYGPDIENYQPGSQEHHGDLENVSMEDPHTGERWLDPHSGTKLKAC